MYGLGAKSMQKLPRAPGCLFAWAAAGEEHRCSLEQTHTSAHLCACGEAKTRTVVKVTPRAR